MVGDVLRSVIEHIQRLPHSKSVHRAFSSHTVIHMLFCMSTVDNIAYSILVSDHNHSAIVGYMIVRDMLITFDQHRYETAHARTIDLCDPTALNQISQAVLDLCSGRWR